VTRQKFEDEKHIIKKHEIVLEGVGNLAPPRSDAKPGAGYFGKSSSVRFRIWRAVARAGRHRFSTLGVGQSNGYRSSKSVVAATLCRRSSKMMEILARRGCGGTGRAATSSAARSAATDIPESCALPVRSARCYAGGVVAARPLLPGWWCSRCENRWKWLKSSRCEDEVELVALQPVAPRVAAQRTGRDRAGYLFVPPAPRGRVRRSATNATASESAVAALASRS
jgi:hypothetical protein